MLATITASILLTHRVGERLIDPRNLFGANLSDLGQHLFALLGCYQISAAAIESAWGDRLIKYWRAAALLIAVALILTYRFSGAWTTASEEFQLSDSWSLAHDWLNLISILACFIAVLLASVEIMVVGPRRLSMFLMYCLATIVIGCIGTAAILLVAEPDWVHAEYHAWVTKWTNLGLWVMGAAGIPALWDAWKHRDEPR